MDQWEQKNNRNISKIDSKDRSTKTRVTLPYNQGGLKGPELGLPSPCSDDIDETEPDTQEDAGTSKGQMHTTEKLGCCVPGPMQGLQRHLHRGDGEQIWSEIKGAQERCKDSGGEEVH